MNECCWQEPCTCPNADIWKVLPNMETASVVTYSTKESPNYILKAQSEGLYMFGSIYKKRYVK